MLTLERVRKSHGKTPVLEEIDLQVKRGKVLCILGPSGCGKTTLLQLVAGLEKPCGGQVKKASPNVAYMFQEDRLIPWQTVYENIALVKKAADPSQVRQWIDSVGLTDFETSYPKGLSGGMKQRCALARALYYEAPLMLLDEPFHALDHQLRSEMGQLFLQVQKQRGATALLVTHQIDEALALADEIAILSPRPCRVLDIIPLPMDQDKRDLNDSKIQAIRRRLVRLLMQERE